MVVKSANVAGQIPVFTANTMKRCKIFAVLGIKVNDQIQSAESAMQCIAMHTYLPNGVAARLRRSKNVRKMAIRTSIPAATERHTAARFCPPDAEVLGSYP